MVEKVQYKLYYFDVRGGGEAIRMLLKYAKKPFEDVRVSMEQWQTMKSSQSIFENYNQKI